MFKCTLRAFDLNDRRLEEHDVVVTAGTAKACGYLAKTRWLRERNGPFRYYIGKVVWTGADERPVQGKLF